MSTTEKTILNTQTPGIEVEVVDPNHCRYDITGFDTAKNPHAGDKEGYRASFSRGVLVFQSKKTAQGEVPDGITDETLAAILIHRLRAYHNSLAACPANSEALLHAQMMQGLLMRRGLQRNGAPQ